MPIELNLEDKFIFITGNNASKNELMDSELIFSIGPTEGARREASDPLARVRRLHTENQDTEDEGRNRPRKRRWLTTACGQPFLSWISMMLQPGLCMPVVAARAARLENDNNPWQILIFCRRHPVRYA